MHPSINPLRAYEFFNKPATNSLYRASSLSRTKKYCFATRLVIPSMDVVLRNTSRRNTSQRFKRKFAKSIIGAILRPTAPTATHETRKGVNLRFQFETHVALLKETDDLVCCCYSRIVVRLEGLGAHLFLGENDALHVLVTDQLFDCRLILRSDIREVTEIGALFQNLQEVGFVYDFHASCVDEGAALGQLR